MKCISLFYSIGQVNICRILLWLLQVAHRTWDWFPGSSSAVQCFHPNSLDINQNQLKAVFLFIIFFLCFSFSNAQKCYYLMCNVPHPRWPPGIFQEQTHLPIPDADGLELKILCKDSAAFWLYIPLLVYLNTLTLISVDAVLAILGIFHASWQLMHMLW